MVTMAEKLAGLNAMSLRQSALYMLQLAVEWEISGAEHNNGAKLLATLVFDLETHRRARQEGSLTSRLVSVREAVLRLVVPGETEGALKAKDEAALAEIERLLYGAGVRKTEIASLLAGSLRKGTVDASLGDKLNDKLASLAGVGQTSFRNEVQVKESDLEKVGTGKRHTRFDTERAAMDQAPDDLVLLAYVVNMLGIDEDTCASILGEFDPRGVKWYLDGEVRATKVAAEARRVVAGAAQESDGAATLAQGLSSPTVSAPTWLDPVLRRRPEIRSRTGKSWWVPEVLAADLVTLTLWAEEGNSRGVRARAILRLADGRSWQTVAIELGVDVGTLCIWKAAFRRGGLTALELAQPQGLISQERGPALVP